MLRFLNINLPLTPGEGVGPCENRRSRRKGKKDEARNVSEYS